MKMPLNIFFLSCILSFSCQHNNEKLDNPDYSGTLTVTEISNGVLTPEILWKLGRVAGIEISPDGENILFTITKYDTPTEKKTTTIYTIPTKGGEPFDLTEDRFIDVSPQWIKNGKRIAFLSDRFGDMQVWSMYPNCTGKKQLTDIEGGINGFRISPDGKYLLYTKDVKLEKNINEKYADLPKANAYEINDLMYRHWDSWHDYSFSHIFITKINDKTITNGKDIMENEPYNAPPSPFFDELEISWSPDSKTIAYTCKKLYGKEYATSTNSDIYLYNIESETTNNITSNNLGYDKYPVFSSSGNKIAWMSMKTPGYESDKNLLMVMNLADKSVSCINENWDQNAKKFVWSANEKDIFFISGKNATYQIYKANIETKKFSAITQGQHNINEFSISKEKIVAAKSTHQMATELFTIDIKTNKEKQLTNVNKNIYDNIDFGHTEEKWVKTSDGKKMLVWVIYPPNFDPNKKYPALLYCQGGPQSAVSQFFSYRWNFALMAANGYIVVAPNRRGVPTFGQEWNAQISGDYSGQNIKDYLSAIDALSKEPYIDETRLGCVGASYGGYSVFYLAGHHNKRFKAFISHCGIFNLESMYGATEEIFFVNHDFGGAYWEKDNKTAQRTYANSPHKFVQNWNTPIMIIHGGNDFRIPYTESLQAFNAAQLQGIPSKLIFFPEESHWVKSPQNAILWQREFFGWLDKYLKE